MDLTGRPIVTTPNVLTEVSNLLGNFKGRERELVFQSFSSTIALLSEVYVESHAACQDVAFSKFGLVDSVLLGLAMDGHFLLTSDMSLASLIQSRGGSVMTIDAIRSLNH